MRTTAQGMKRVGRTSSVGLVILVVWVGCVIALASGCGGMPTADGVRPNDDAGATPIEPASVTEGGTVVDGGSPLKAGTYNGTIDCLRTFTDGSTEVSTQVWIVVIGNSGMPMAGGDEIVPGMVLTPPPNSTSPPETVLNVIVSANAVVILTEFEDQVTLCANTCQFSFDDAAQPYQKHG